MMTAIFLMMIAAFDLNKNVPYNFDSNFSLLAY
jgi:hypothetical protein